MFTGIVSERGRVAALDGDSDGIRLEIDAQEIAGQARPGDSISIDGCCLTVTRAENGRLAFDAMPESLRRSTLRGLALGEEVNLEAALRAGDPLGGHYVQGHVDGVGRVAAIDHEGDSRRVWFEAPPEILRYCVEKGSIAVAGVSLTIAALRAGAFEVALVRHTLDQTTLGRLEVGDEVNLEVDMLAKYVERLLDPDTISHA